MIRLNKKGFTLIELLIVIVIIGILAVAVLSSINPIEQRDKARDAAHRSDAAELLNAVERYYATNGQYPWDVTGDTITSVGTSQTTSNIPALSGSGVSNWVDELVNENEVKPEFFRRSSMANIAVWLDGTTQLVRVCFVPQSNSAQNDATYDDSGQINATNPTHLCLPE